MNTKTNLRSSLRVVNAFNPAAIRELVERGKAIGWIQAADQARPVEKNGVPATALDKVRSQWIDVTPEMAQRWLKNNFGNRPLREDTVKAYARDMVQNMWVATHQGIAFNDLDELIDGQHRLSAIVMANVTVRTMVTFGLPSQIEGKQVTTMDAVDRGATRSVADQLTIQHGFKNGSITAAICSALASLCFGERTRRLSVAQTLEVFQAFRASVLFVIEQRSKQVGLRTAGVLAGFAFAYTVEPKAIGPLFTRLNSGLDLAEGSPIKLLRSFLTGPEAKLFTRSLDRGLAEIVLQALNCELAGRKLDKLEMSLEGVARFSAPQADRVEKIAQMFKLPGTAKGKL